MKQRTIGSGVGLLLLLTMIFCCTACVHLEYPARKRKQDADAARWMRTLASRQIDYYSSHGRYARSFSELSEAGPIDRQQFCTGGYCYSLKPMESGYEMRAWPEKRGESGYRSFYLDQTGLLRFSLGTQAGPSDEILR